MLPSASRSAFMPALLRKFGHGTLMAWPRKVMSTRSTHDANCAPYAVFRSALASASSSSGLAATIQRRAFTALRSDSAIYALNTVFSGGRTRMSWWVETTKPSPGSL